MDFGVGGSPVKITPTATTYQTTFCVMPLPQTCPYRQRWAKACKIRGYRLSKPLAEFSGLMIGPSLARSKSEGCCIPNTGANLNGPRPSLVSSISAPIAFRHTYRSWLDAVGTAIAVQQKMMRHSDIRTTVNIYGDVVTDEMTTAGGKVAQLAFRSN